jgi:thiol-disulfide isomerase/thioredoxin
MFNRLYSVTADYIVLVFWDVDCGHCQKEIPKLIKLYNELKQEKKDLKVYSVYTLHEGDKYLKYIADNGLQDWINVYDGAHINNVTVKYDVYSTPVIYILDKNKKIKAKRIGVEQVKDIIGEMEKEYLKK